MDRRGGEFGPEVLGALGLRAGNLLGRTLTLQLESFPTSGAPGQNGQEFLPSGLHVLFPLCPAIMIHCLISGFHLISWTPVCALTRIKSSGQY